jgi:hypothetical protein
MGLDSWNWRLPVELQDVPWDCAAASLTWCLNTIGRTETEADVVAGLGPARISPAYGLLDASGAGLVEYLGELGISSECNSSASFDDVLAAAGYQPMLMGGREWCHWVGVRIGSPLFPSANDQMLALANPAPGWMGINQVITRYEFDQLGAFSAVWFTSW